MPVPMNAPAQLAQARAELDRMKAKESEALKASEATKSDNRKNARRATMIGAGCLALGFAFGWFLADQRGLPLPERFVPVYVITSTGRAKVAYTDENNTFRSVETGEPVYQVTNWTRP